MNNTINNSNLKTADELFALKYGEKESATRIEFEAKAKAFFICKMLKEERKKQKFHNPNWQNAPQHAKNLYQE